MKYLLACLRHFLLLYYATAGFVLLKSISTRFFFLPSSPETQYGSGPRVYTIKMDVVIMGLHTIVVDTTEEYNVGQKVVVSPTSGVSIRDTNGNAVSLPLGGVSMSGTVVAKE